MKSRTYGNTNFKRNITIYEKYIKRPLDFFSALLGIVILSPVMLIIGLLVRIKLGSPIIFKQKRPGLNEKIFTMYKFRTMTDEKDENGKLLPDEVRLTEFGNLLRHTSLDELPELINILNGDLAICGPRPQLVRDMTFMNKEQRKRHLVRPGLTGLAQTRGRNALDWEEKLKTDLEYVEHITFLGDMKILFSTVKQVLFRRKGGNDASVDEIDITDDYGDYLLKKGLLTVKEYELKQEEAYKLLQENDKFRTRK